MSELTREQAVEVLSRYVGNRAGATKEDYEEKTEALHAVSTLRNAWPPEDAVLVKASSDLRLALYGEAAAGPNYSAMISDAVRRLSERASHDLKLELLTKQRDDALDLVKVMASSVEAMSLVLKVHR